MKAIEQNAALCRGGTIPMDGTSSRHGQGRAFFIMNTITIDPEFKALIPPLAPEELAQLEANILQDGCRDPLVTWQGTLIDGHNRHAICTKHGIEFETVAMEFADRSHVKEWIIRNQFGRRNLLPYVRTELALELEKTIAARSRQGKRTDIPKDDNFFQKSEKSEPLNATKELAAIAGVSHDTVAKVKKIIAKAAPEVKAKLASGEISINQAHLQITRTEKEEKRESRREENRAKVAEAATPEEIAESGAKFATIMIDPPWDWGDEGDQDQLGRARPDYATMSKEQLLALPLPDLADDDCHLYLWITNRSLPKGFELMERWGFRYVTAITWAKPHFGMGNYFRGQTEHVLFGVKGSQPLKRKDVGTLFESARGKGGHSSKPPEFYKLVESCSPGPFLEMFSRSEREGWKTWGENA
jgi:N6-adenosine-specific RNA methylase IME4